MKNRDKGFGIFSCTVLIIGSMIGSAVFSLSGLTMLNAGPSAILSWIIAAVIMLFYGLICSELASRYPESGGTYLFPAKAFNSSLLGWISSWGSILSNTVAVAFSSIYVGIYLGAGFGLSSSWQIPLALVSAVFCAFLNFLSSDTQGKMSSSLVILLVVTMAVYICFGFFGNSWQPENLVPFFSQGVRGKTGFLISVPTAMLGYGNIVSMAFLVSSIREPSKTVPKSVSFAMLTVTLLYVLMILSTCGLVSTAYLKDNPDMAFIPMYAACFTALAKYSWMAKLISVSAVLALLTTNMILIPVTAHSLTASAKDGILPAFFKHENRSGIPDYSICTVVVFACAVSCFPAFTQVIVNYGALFAAVTVVINILSVIKSRKSCQNSGEIFTAPGRKLMPYLLIAVILVCYIPDFVSGWQIWLYSILIYIAGYAVFRFRAIDRF